MSSNPNHEHNPAIVCQRCVIRLATMHITPDKRFTPPWVPEPAGSYARICGELCMSDWEKQQYIVEQPHIGEAI